jgi:hypothetical protein
MGGSTNEAMNIISDEGLYIYNSASYFHTSATRSVADDVDRAMTNMEILVDMWNLALSLDSISRNMKLQGKMIWKVKQNITHILMGALMRPVTIGSDA